MTSATLKRKADKIGQLKAQVSDLNEKIDQLKQELIDAKVTEVDGKLFRVTLSTEEKAIVDWKSIAATYELPLKKFTRYTPSIRMNVVSRK